MFVRCFRKDKFKITEGEISDDFARTTKIISTTVVTPKLIPIGSKGLDYDEGLPQYHFKVLERNEHRENGISVMDMIVEKIGST